MEEIPPAREIPRARKRCMSKREGGEERERRVVTVEEEGERESFSHLAEDVLRLLIHPRGIPNRDRDRQMPILMDRRSRSSPADRTLVSLCGTLVIALSICHPSSGHPISVIPV